MHLTPEGKCYPLLGPIRPPSLEVKECGHIIFGRINYLFHPIATFRLFRTVYFGSQQPCNFCPDSLPTWLFIQTKTLYNILCRKWITDGFKVVIHIRTHQKVVDKTFWVAEWSKYVAILGSWTTTTDVFFMVED